MNDSTSKIDINRDIGDFFYDLKPTRDAGVGLTEQTIDYIVDVMGEPDGYARSAKRLTTSLKANRFQRTI